MNEQQGIFIFCSVCLCWIIGVVLARGILATGVIYDLADDLNKQRLFVCAHC